MSNEITNWLKSFFSRLSIRAKVVAAIAVIALAGGVIVAGNLASAARQEQFLALISQVDSEISAGSQVGARKYFDEARLVSPDEKTILGAYEKKLKEFSNSLNSLSTAQDHIAGERYLLAIDELNQVSDLSRALFTKSSSLIEENRDLALNAELSKAKDLADESNYRNALQVITGAQKVLGNLDQLVQAQDKYEAKVAQQEKALAQKKKALRASYLSRMYKKYDEFNSTTWYQDSSSPRYTNRNAFYLYFGASGSSTTPLRLRVQYYDDDWLFVNSAQISVDGVVYNLNMSEWERDNDSNIWEWADELLSDRDMIEAIIKSKRATLRFDGSQYYDTRTISPTQKSALKNVLNAYDAF